MLPLSHDLNADVNAGGMFALDVYWIFSVLIFFVWNFWELFPPLTDGIFLFFVFLAYTNFDIVEHSSFIIDVINQILLLWLNLLTNDII